MSTAIAFTVPNEYGGITVKSFLRGYCHVSASLLAKLKRTEDGILLTVCAKNTDCHGKPSPISLPRKLIATDILHTGSTVTITLPKEHSDIEPVDLPIEILYEDEHIIAFNKKSGMAVHPVRGHQGDTLANAAAYHAAARGESYAFHAVNRLDRDTTGVLLTAKNAYAASFLSDCASKVYYALCEGAIEHCGTVDAPIRVKAGHTIEREVCENGEGAQRAVTHYEPIEMRGGCTLVKFFLETGRTHQIRVHMAHIGHPVAGDSMYGGRSARIAGNDACMGEAGAPTRRSFLSGQALHCGEMSFPHPVTHEYMTITAPLPF